MSTPPLPAAIAGDDFKTVTGATGVTLDGSKSFDPAGGSLTYLWEQVSGTGVTLSVPTAAVTTFDAPSGPETLTFRLTVTGTHGSDSDTIDVAVKSVIVSAPDTWFVGYGNGGSLTATVTGGTGPLTFEWSGIEPWLTASGTASATLTYSAPLLADFQNFPDRAEVAVIEKTTQGRLQLKIKATDTASGDTDEDIVNFSVGPFATAVAHENVAFGEPVLLNGGETTSSGAITSWSWSGTKPNGSSISFFRQNKAALAGSISQRFVYFVPDQVGPYQIILTQNPGSLVKVIDITCGKYTGVGNLTGTTPDPFKGECAACHAGQLPWLANFADSWLDTGHASMYSRILDPSDPHYDAAQSKGHWEDAFDFGSNYSIDSRVVGFSRITSGTHNGWAQRAEEEGYVFQGTSWEELKRKHPMTARMSNVQCESCHGPGSEHAGDTTGIRKSFDASLCGRCHSRKQDLWEASGHGRPPIASPSGNASCNNCHTAQGFVVEMRAQEGADPHPALFANSDLRRPVIPSDQRRNTSCQTCHDPHKKTAQRPAGGAEPQLRAFGNVEFRNAVVTYAGEAAVCYLCHQSRTDTRAGSTDINVRRAPHDSTAAEMLAGTNGIHFPGWSYTVSPHGIPSRFVAPGRTETRHCLSCHNDVQPSKGMIGYNALGGHTFNMKQGSGTAVAGDATHAGGATVAGTKKFVVSSGSSFLKQVFTGDTLVIASGADAGGYTVLSVDGARQVTLNAPANFTGNAAGVWTLTSVVKYNVASCTQCHTTALDFRVTARGDYDGDGSVEAVQDEIEGLRTAVEDAINVRLAALVGSGYSLTTTRGRIGYTNGTMTRTFPGPSVTTSDNPEKPWADLSEAERAEWTALYQAAYNVFFVEHDKSHGIHNTGYAVNLLQASYQAVTGSLIGAAFVLFP